MYKKIFFLLLLVININAHAFVQEIGPGVFVHIGKHLDVDEGYDGDICNIGFIVGEESIAVIDTVVQRGGFRGEELSTIGQLRDQCVQIVALAETEMQNLAQE